MNYYKDNESNEIYAYDDVQLSQAIRLKELESLIQQDEGAELTSSEYNLLKDEYDSVLPVVFDILGNINSMSELTEEEAESYTNPPVSNNILIEGAERQRQIYLNEAADKIAPLQDAIDLNIATDIEVAALIAWKEYRVKLIRVDVSTVPDIDWPVQPE